jgi:hypothetical protein
MKRHHRDGQKHHGTINGGKAAYKNIIMNTNNTELKNFGKFLHELNRKWENQFEKNGTRFRESKEGGIRNRNALLYR